MGLKIKIDNLTTWTKGFHSLYTEQADGGAPLLTADGSGRPSEDSGRISAAPVRRTH
ncbi:hypothetical protein [Stenotrophomonas phage CM2]